MIKTLFYWMLGKIKKIKSDLNSHKDDLSAHHTKYTDTESVNAVENADPLELDNALSINEGYFPTSSYHFSSCGNTLVTGGLSPKILLSKVNSSLDYQSIFALYYKYQLTKTTYPSRLLYMFAKYDIIDSWGYLYFKHYYNGSVKKPLHLEFFGSNNKYCSIDILKNPSNHNDAPLSGTPRVVTIRLGSPYYYFKVYPTKT